MCLAKAYVQAPGAGPRAADDKSGLLLENVTQVDVQGDTVRLRSLFGDIESLRGRIARIDFSEGTLVLESAGA